MIGDFQRISHRQFLSRILLILFLIGCLVPSTLYSRQKEQLKGLYEDLFSVSFPTERDGWACGRWGTVLHTADSGNTWDRQSSGTNYTLSSIFFVDPENGWAVGSEGTIIHSRDGGKTWEKQKSPVPFFLMKVYFATPLKGWIVTERTHILSTEDGGKTWSIQFKDEDFILKSISFCDGVHGWAVGEYGYIYRTSDGGVSWKKQAGHFSLSTETGDVVGDPFLFDVFAIDPLTAWVVGIDGYVAKTVDGGKTWKGIEIGGAKAPFFCIVSGKKDTILIGSKGVLFYSNNRGKTWQIPKFEPPLTYGWLYGLARQGPSGFVAVGWEGAIYLTSSTSWKRVSY